MRRFQLFACGAVVALAAVGCSRGEDPFRLAVQVDCQGGLASYSDMQLAGAYLPLLERGARLAGTSVRSGLARVQLSGTPVDVEVACTESLEPTVAVPQLRRLLEERRPDAVITGGLGGQDGLIVRDLAKRHPDVTFLVTVPTAQEITLYDASPNVFRVGPDNAQLVAGLATYAYRQLGWRRAAVVTGTFPDDWESAAGFIAEFCALGGTAVRDDGRAWVEPARAAARYAATVDGVAVLPSFVPPAAFMRAVGRQNPDAVGARMVLGGWGFADPANLVVDGARLRDVVVATSVPRDQGPPAWRRYVASFERTFEQFPAGTAAVPMVLPYRNAMAAFAAAFEHAGGDPGHDGARLRASLTRISLPTVPDATTLDEHRQGIGTVYLSRVGDRTRRPTSLGVVRGVDAAFGGIFGPPGRAPTAITPGCDRTAAPPRWAR